MTEKETLERKIELKKQYYVILHDKHIELCEEILKTKAEISKLEGERDDLSQDMRT